MISLVYMTSSKETQQMARDYLDWTSFDTPEASLDLLENSVRKGVKYDAYGEQKVFQAMVLTPARRITNTEGAGIGVVSKEGVNVESPLYTFKARLLGENSPHMLIPDPCSLDKNSDPRYVEAMIEMHISVVFVKTGIVDPPGAGDIVLVELKKNDMSYDLQKATFLRSVARNVSTETFLSTKGCALSFERFDDLAPFVNAPLPLGGGFVDFVPTTAWPVVISPQSAIFITRLRKMIPKDKIRVIYINSCVRDATKQARALYTKRTINKCESAISGKPADGSPCSPIYNLYKNKDLIMEILRTPNSESEMARVISAQVARQKYLSSHLTGRALDFSVRNLDKEQINLVEKAVKSLKATYKYENDPPHIHIEFGPQSTVDSSTDGVTSEDTSSETEDVYKSG